MDQTTKFSDDGDVLKKDTPKRKVKKNLREKRRSTGVIIMPTDTSATNGDDEIDVTKANTLYNEETTGTIGSTSSNNHSDYIAGEDDDDDTFDMGELNAQLDDYKFAIDEWQKAYTALNTELDTLRETNAKLEQENIRLKGEYDALMKVVKLMKK